MTTFLRALCVTIATVLPVTGQAQTYCADREMVIDRLASGYGESFQGGGLQSEDRVFEVWFSDEDRTWTILLTRADGTSCVMASGTNWRQPLPSDKLKSGIPG